MQSPGREPSMEDILASIKKVIAEEKELRTAVHPAAEPEAEESLPRIAPRRRKSSSWSSRWPRRSTSGRR